MVTLINEWIVESSEENYKDVEEHLVPLLVFREYNYLLGILSNTIKGEKHKSRFKVIFNDCDKYLNLLASPEVNEEETSYLEGKAKEILVYIYNIISKNE
jgi:hypothetical protein